jgi:hypothetical protein
VSPDPTPEFASVDDIRQAIEALTPADSARLRQAGKLCLAGSEYGDPDELLNEALARTFRAAQGEKGRQWSKDVAFMAFLIMTMSGLADDSRKSAYMRKRKKSEPADGVGTAEKMAGQGHCHADVVTLAVEAGERVEAAERAKHDMERIDAFFTGDAEIQWLLMGHKDGLPAAEIRELSGMNLVTYASARRRFRRGLEKLFPGRSEK